MKKLMHLLFFIMIILHLELIGCHLLVLKHSGYGVGGIKYTMEDMQIDKMLVLKNKKKEYK